MILWLRVAMAVLLLSGIAVNSFLLYNAPIALVIEGSPEVPSWLPWLGLAVASLAAVGYFALDVLAYRQSAPPSTAAAEAKRSTAPPRSVIAVSALVALILIALALGHLTATSAYDWLYLLATGGGAIAVATFTFKLWRSTDKLWEASNSQSEVLIDSSAPYVYPDLMSNEDFLRIRGHLPGGYRPDLMFRYENYGDTPAIVVEHHHQLVIAQDLPDQPYYSAQGAPRFTNGLVVGAHNRGQNVLRAALPEFIENWLQTHAGRRIFLVGYVAYEDFFGFVHRTCYAHEVIVTAEGLAWRESGGKKYNERRKEKRGS